MTKEEAQATLEFISRIHLKPQEINAFIQIQKALQAIVDQPLDEPKSSGIDSAWD